MRHSLIIKIWQASTILIAFGTGYWQWLQQKPLVALIATPLSVLLAGLPLPLIASKPLVMYRIGCRAEELGIKVHKKSILSELAYASTLVFAHSRLITNDETFITELRPEGISQGSLLSMAASVEASSSHPIGKLIYQTAAERHLRLQPAVNFNEYPGQGAEAIISRIPVRVGTAAWLKEEGADISADFLTRADQLSLKGMIPVFVSSGKYSRGLIAVQREISFDTIAALHRLQKLGLKLMLMTGGNKRIATYIKKQTNIDEIRFEIFPEQKVRELHLMRTRKEVIALLGDSKLDSKLMEAADVRIDWLPPPAGKQAYIAADEAENENPAPNQQPDPDFPEDPPQEDSASHPHEKDAVLPHISLPYGNFLALARLRHRAAVGMQIAAQQRKIAIFFCLLLMIPATNLLAPFDVPFLDPILALLGNLLLTVFILLLSFRA